MKQWWMSKTVWGGLIAAGAGLAGLAGWTLDDASQAQLVDAAVAVASGIGGVLAVYGRVKATKAIGP